jgi:HAMP domain-containing protein/anti-sigma regulatory factor (Ser/Thr protein kinase)
MNFRAKLLGILAVPVVALICITVFAGTERVVQASDASNLQHMIAVVSASTTLDEQVQLEEVASAQAIGGGGGDDLASRRGATDVAAQQFRSAVSASAGAAGGSFVNSTENVQRHLSALASYRSAVDQGTDANAVVTSYGELTGGLSDLVGAIAEHADDPGLSRDTASLAALSHVKDATASEWAVLDAALTDRAFAGAESALLRGAISDRDRWEGIYEGLAGQSAGVALRTALAGDAVATAEAIEQQAFAATSSAGLPDAGEWHAAMQTRLGIVGTILHDATNSLSSRAATAESAAVQDLRTFLLVSVAAVLASIVMGLLLARSVSQPLRRLTRAAEKLAGEQLPALVNGLRNPGPEDERYLAATIRPIEIQSHDEIGQLAKAFNTVQTVAVDVAAEQAALLRKGIGDIFVNLARRNQVLIDRQIEFLDELEASADDPDLLAHLYKLDHLATRMRRNAESLLVLAGVEPKRARSRPVPLVDVARAAIGEVEDYARVDIVRFDEIEVTGGAAVDLGHLLAELLENATHFSSPDTRVVLDGHQSRGGYVITVTDQGVGMTDTQLAEINDLLSAPPAVGLALSRSLGFTVVARLASRYGIGVRVAVTERRGVEATVHVPHHLVVWTRDEEAPAPAAPEAASAPVPAPVAAPPPEPVSAPVFEEPWQPEWDGDDDEDTDDSWLDEFDPLPANLVDAVPQGRDFDQGLAALVRGDELLGPAGLVEPPVVVPEPHAAPAPEPDPDPVPLVAAGPAVEPEVTAAGLTRRQPKARTSRDAAPRPTVTGPSVAPSRRSPDEVRAMLARYRDGQEQGRGAETTEPPDGEDP